MSDDGIVSADRRIDALRTADRVLAAAESAAQSVARLQAPFRAAVPERSSMEPVVLAGSGAWGRETARRLASAGRPAAAFIDNAVRAQGAVVEGLSVLSPADAIARFGVDALYVVAIYNGNGVHRQLVAAGCRRVLSARDFYFGLPDIFIPYYQLDWPDTMFDAAATVADVDRCWHDDVSRRVYAGLLATRAGLPAPDVPIGSPRDCYFDPGLFEVASTDCVVDCGAFDGDTIRQVLAGPGAIPDHIVALEPDRANAVALRRFVETDPTAKERVRVIEAAASSQSGETAFGTAGTVAARVGGGNDRVATIALDDLEATLRPTIVKMDIEGHEMDALRGAGGLLRSGDVVLAISLYHRAEDLWCIPAFIRALNPAYRMFLRCYAEGGWESVCYAIPAARHVKERR